MTTYAIAIYRRETREALSSVMGRPVSNEEQNMFIAWLLMRSNKILAAEAKAFSEMVEREEAKV
jgi:hypothetical protein